jgi:hypothetical protein
MAEGLRRWKVAVAAVAIALVSAGCGDRGVVDAADAGSRQGITAVELDEVVLKVDEAPEGTEYLAERSGTLRVDELWPSDCCPGPQLTFEDAGFASAYARVFEMPGHSDDPIDTRPGWEEVSSAAVLFDTSTGASEALREWLEYYDSPELEKLSTDGLGEEAAAITGSPNAPAEVFYLYLWRVDRAVLALRVSVGAGSVSGAEVRELVDRMDARVT